jgi:hypothetical protein
VHPHLSLPALLLVLVQAAAVAVAFTAPGQHALAGLVVLTGLVSRSVLRYRHRAPVVAAAGAVRPADAPAG